MTVNAEILNGKLNELSEIIDVATSKLTEGNIPAAMQNFFKAIELKRRIAVLRAEVRLSSTGDKSRNISNAFKTSLEKIEMKFTELRRLTRQMIANDLWVPLYS
ncbi:hypothetical protein GQF03_05630 [Sneathiella chungangensis]|uniref:Uncharacterized protein n=1 Tax=Sneathiella chungangensis TaxID=1418234 RepID=A0A845MDN7_9PROT|nr:hypothetical protein [Sneathiella chungangensis]MZR21805.1 hypothetical protein [Sneathiella chungangensis]